jgi:hypothetical protein
MAEDQAKEPSSKYDSGLARYRLKLRIWLYNKGIIGKLEYENKDGGTTYRRRTETFAKNLKSLPG